MKHCRFQGRADIAKLLLAHGLDKSERHSDGFTPIHRVSQEAEGGSEEGSEKKGGREGAGNGG